MFGFHPFGSAAFSSLLRIAFSAGTAAVSGGGEVTVNGGFTGRSAGLIAVSGGGNITATGITTARTVSFTPASGALFGFGPMGSAPFSSIRIAPERHVGARIKARSAGIATGAVTTHRIASRLNPLGGFFGFGPFGIVPFSSIDTANEKPDVPRIHGGGFIAAHGEGLPVMAAGSGAVKSTQWTGNEGAPFGQWTMPRSAAARISRLNLVRLEGGGWGIGPNPADAKFVELEGGGLGVEEGAETGRKLARGPDGLLIIYE